MCIAVVSATWTPPPPRHPLCLRMTDDVLEPVRPVHCCTPVYAAWQGARRRDGGFQRLIVPERRRVAGTFNSARWNKQPALCTKEPDKQNGTGKAAAGKTGGERRREGSPQRAVRKDRMPYNKKVHKGNTWKHVQAEQGVGARHAAGLSGRRHKQVADAS